jgi:chromosome segregation ATPase
MSPSPSMDQLIADVSVLKTDVRELKTDVSVLKTDVSVLKTDVSVLKTDVSVLKTDVSVLKTDVGHLRQAAVQTTAILVDHSEQLDRLRGSVDGLRRTFDERFWAVTDRLDRLLAMTLAERTRSVERSGAIDRLFESIDRRLEALERAPTRG